jgi:hypothetical protein
MDLSKLDEVPPTFLLRWRDQLDPLGRELFMRSFDVIRDLRQDTEVIGSKIPTHRNR